MFDQVGYTPEIGAGRAPFGGRKAKPARPAPPARQRLRAPVDSRKRPSPRHPYTLRHSLQSGRPHRRLGGDRADQHARILWVEARQWRRRPNQIANITVSWRGSASPAEGGGRKGEGAASRGQHYNHGRAFCPGEFGSTRRYSKTGPTSTVPARILRARVPRPFGDIDRHRNAAIGPSPSLRNPAPDA